MICTSILIIEDNDEIREVLEDALKSEGYRVYSVKNGREGLAALKRIEGPCLILLDMMMPEMNGWEFMEYHQPNTAFPMPVVVISALGATQALSKGALPLNATGYIRKPVDLSTLYEIVRQYCGVPGEAQFDPILRVESGIPGMSNELAG